MNHLKMAGFLLNHRYNNGGARGTVPAQSVTAVSIVLRLIGLSFKKQDHLIYENKYGYN